MYALRTYFYVFSHYYTVLAVWAWFLFYAVQVFRKRSVIRSFRSSYKG
jgi:hypothetical protein